MGLVKLFFVPAKSPFILYVMFVVCPNAALLLGLLAAERRYLHAAGFEVHRVPISESPLTPPPFISTNHAFNIAFVCSVMS